MTGIHWMPGRRIVPIVGLLIVIPPGGIIRVFEMGIAVVDILSSPNSRNSNFDLSVRTFQGNESQSTYHDRDQEKSFHMSIPSFFFCFSFFLFTAHFLGCKNVFAVRSLD